LGGDGAKEDVGFWGLLAFFESFRVERVMA
jgi:hypothetical protein